MKNQRHWFVLVAFALMAGLGYAWLVHSQPKLSTADTTASGNGSLIIETNPSGAVVTIDGKLNYTAPIKVDDLKSGNHKVVVKLNHYATTEKTVSIRSRQTTKVDISLSSD
jgi:hypothetical protein